MIFAGIGTAQQLESRVPAPMKNTLCVTVLGAQQQPGLLVQVSAPLSLSLSVSHTHTQTQAHSDLDLSLSGHEQRPVFSHRPGEHQTPSGTLCSTVCRVSPLKAEGN